MDALIVIAAAGVIAAGAAWVYGEVVDLRWVRVTGAAALLVGSGLAGVVGAAVSAFGANLQLSSDYAERLEPFRAAALDRLEAGDAEAVADELRALEGQFTYESGLAFERLEEATERLTADDGGRAPPAVSPER